MKQYLDLVKDVLENGKPPEGDFRSDRTGTGTYSVFGRQLRFDLSKGFPLLTTKKVFLKGIIHELIWFLKGDTNIKYLTANNVNIWNQWADQDGELGPVYGKHFRSWTNWVGIFREKEQFLDFKNCPIDQISNMVETLKTNPYSRRNLVISFNPAEIPSLAPPACHTLFQVYVRGNKLDLQLYQRSADLLLGVPFNIASYALLNMMLAQVSGLEPGDFIHTFGDVHIYSNHIDGAKLQLERQPTELPTMILNKDIKCIFDFKYEDFKLENYNPQSSIKFDISV